MAKPAKPAQKPAGPITSKKKPLTGAEPAPKPAPRGASATSGMGGKVAKGKPINGIKRGK